MPTNFLVREGFYLLVILMMYTFNKATEFLKELGHRLRQVSGEANSYAYLTQRLSVAVQRGNAASVLWTMKSFLYEFCVII